ncbi:MAG TPA: glycosyltransferase family 4 protein [Pyrinomonadaceae bacterium]|nr:glycosyltransferase family 4 protein [Pyrinomonadaceae bacterium]
MRVLHLTPEFPPVIWGGLGTAVGGLATASAHAGISVGVMLVGGALVLGDGSYGAWKAISREQQGLVADESLVVNSDGVFFFQVPPGEAEETGIRLVQKWKPDIVHLHTAWFWPIARAIRERTGTPLVYTVHSLDRAEYEIGDFVTHWDTQETVIAAADRVIALSRDERDLIAKYCPVARERVRIVGNGIDDSTAARAAVRRKRENGSPVVLYSGRFVDRKGVRELFQAIPRVLDQKPNVHFVLAGGYGTAAEIEREWLHGSLHPYRSQIHFTGWLTPDKVSEWYRCADILVMPSWYEPFGMVILEGMLHGLPIAATSVGGPVDILEDKINALLFPPRDVEALTDAILQLVSHPELRYRLGREAAKEVRRNWLWPNIVKGMQKVYGEVAMADLRAAN